MVVLAASFTNRTNGSNIPPFSNLLPWAKFRRCCGRFSMLNCNLLPAAATLSLLRKTWPSLLPAFAPREFAIPLPTILPPSSVAVGPPPMLAICSRWSASISAMPIPVWKSFAKPVIFSLSFSAILLPKLRTISRRLPSRPSSRLSMNLLRMTSARRSVLRVFTKSGKPVFFTIPSNWPCVNAL